MVASVAASSNGVARGALLGSYKVFGCNGYATDDVIIEAIDMAVRDGCDVINLSLATGSGYAEDVSYHNITSQHQPCMDASWYLQHGSLNPRKRRWQPRYMVT